VRLLAAENVPCVGRTDAGGVGLAQGLGFACKHILRKTGLAGSRPLIRCRIFPDNLVLSMDRVGVEEQREWYGRVSGKRQVDDESGFGSEDCPGLPDLSPGLIAGRHPS
jgi:hypothetical protein